ncbi:CoxG family protein [Roseateles amylovorans]|uniref:Uncharacterized protein n=1 Tax=Roseateles amylovorans TaxID=2978473 RepID=A0ABY6AZW1_9BURK|nr:hypothetical protein [Roseateles amylovorans]UXH78706.1 hypothetical protein N4261_01835 [Roseateles amylovorans]
MTTLTLNDDLILPVSQARAWAALQDLTLLRDSLPHGITLDPGASPRSYALSMPAFQGQLTVLDTAAPRQVRLRFDGHGDALGSTEGQVQLRLELLGEHRTLLHVALVLQTQREPSSFRLKTIQALDGHLKRLAEAVMRRHPSDRPPPVKAAPKPWPQRLVDWYLSWFAAIFNGTLYPPPKPRTRSQKPPR